MSKKGSPELIENARNFARELKDRRFSFFTGVPCSLLGTLIEHLESSPNFTYVPNVREDAALGLATGAYLAGRKSCVLMQNSGFGYSLNVLTSLNMIYQIPLLLIISYRGYLGHDAPEHIVMGTKIEKLLGELEIPAFVPSRDKLQEALIDADEAMQKKKIPSVLMIREGLFG